MWCYGHFKCVSAVKALYFTGDFIQSTPGGIHLNIYAAQTESNFKFKQKILLKWSTNLPFIENKIRLFSQIHCNGSNLVSLAFEVLLDQLVLLM